MARRVVPAELTDQVLQQINEQLRRPLAHGIRQGRAGWRLAPQQTHGAGVRRKRRDLWAQPLVVAEAAGQNSEEMLAAGKATLLHIGRVLAHVVLEALPGKLLDDLFEHGSLVAHDIGPRCGG